MSITLSKVEYTYFGSITSEFADFLDSIASEVTPTRMYLSGNDTDSCEYLFMACIPIYSAETYYYSENVWDITLCRF